MAAALKDIDNDAVAILGGVTDNKPAICLLLPQSLVDASFDATAMIREVAKEIQGGGGGQKNLATAGGKNVSGLDKAMEMLKRHFV